MFGIPRQSCSDIARTHLPTNQDHGLTRNGGQLACQLSKCFKTNRERYWPLARKQFLMTHLGMAVMSMRHNYQPPFLGCEFLGYYASLSLTRAAGILRRICYLEVHRLDTYQRLHGHSEYAHGQLSAEADMYNSACFFGSNCGLTCRAILLCHLPLMELHFSVLKQPT